MKYPKLVIEEATALRKHATKEERSNLNFENLNPDSQRRCIYGQMTGDCFSERAKKLIEKSCRRVYSTNGKFADAKLNGSPVGKYRATNGGRLFGQNTDYWSPIELFISKATSRMNQKLIQFIKGEIKSL